MRPEYRFDAELWEYNGEAPWVFVALPEGISDDIEARTRRGPGFGSVKVRVRVGETEWETSLFPDTNAGTYVLPVKRAVRKAEGLAVGDTISVSVRPLEPRTPAT